MHLVWSEIACWVSHWETTEKKENKKHTLEERKIWEIWINYLKNKIKTRGNRRKLWQLKRR